MKNAYELLLSADLSESLGAGIIFHHDSFSVKSAQNVCLELSIILTCKLKFLNLCFAAIEKQSFMMIISFKYSIVLRFDRKYL